MMPQMIARSGTEGKPTSCAGQVNTWKLPFYCTVTFQRPQAPPPILPPPGSYKYYTLDQ
jgi:hypothetical protein